MAAPAAPRYDLVLRGGRVIDPAQGLDGVYDVGIRDGRIGAVLPTIDAGEALHALDLRDRLVVPGLIDTHAHVYQHVTGAFGMNPDLVGIRSGVTTVCDQGGASPLTLQGFRKFIVEPATTRVLAFVSNYLVGGLVGHRYTELYGPHGINVRETIDAIERNRDLVKGIKAHAEVGGYSRWGIETLKLAKEASRETGVPVYVHLGRLWAEADGARIDPDVLVPELVPLLDPGDVIAHPFTKNTGAFVSREGTVHPLIFEAVRRGVRIDVGRGGHLSFAAARTVLDAGIVPFTVGADVHGYTIRRPDDGSWDGGYFDERAARRRDPARPIGPHAPVRPIGGASVFSLIQVINELLALGLRLPDVIGMVTANAATMLGLEGEIGTLAPGVAADVSVLARDVGRWTLEDSLGVQLTANERLRPEFALKDGRLHSSDSSLLFESTKGVA
ncbi:MAG TPA: amidohydrolase/deacetylase family metallohydrolase [Candidatus Acidoferrum sp.]|nr:amidohydrolase/deacetylase family metallohydrolase [Candidatus Acidoferrum sp.]